MSEPKDVILNAIRVLRSRRVRPSGAKIAWYARREFLQSEEITNLTLQDLVRTGIILKVVYKGGTSYRVASHRIYKLSNQIAMTSGKAKVPAATFDVLRPVLGAIAACGSCATKERIGNQLIDAGREDLIERLDILLQKEVRVGVIGKKTVFVSGRTLPAYFITRNSPFATIGKNYQPVASPSSKQKQQPVDSIREQTMKEGPKKSPAPFEHLQQLIKKQQREKEAKDSDESSPETSGRSKGTSISDKSPADESSQETEYQRLLEEEGASSVDPSSKKSATRRGRPRKTPVLYEDVSALLSQTFVTTNRRGRPPKTGSSSRGRTIKRARKVFDPSSETPGRKKNVSVSPPEPTTTTTTTIPLGRCDTCGQNSTPQSQLLVCHRCPTKAHPSCLGYSAQLADRSRRGPWTCMDCKLCEICYFDHTVGTLIFCDECDRAFHLTCHQPALDEQPQGSWVCFICCPNDGFNVYEYLQHGLPTPRDSPIFDDESRGSSGSWEHRSYDPNIPNASSWTIDHVVEYFNVRGYEEYSNSFREHEVDGTALMMLTRMDVLTGLGLLLGPALHIYKEVRILQTRNPDPPLP